MTRRSTCIAGISSLAIIGLAISTQQAFSACLCGGPASFGGPGTSLGADLTIGNGGFLLGDAVITGGSVISNGTIDPGVSPTFSTDHKLGPGFTGTASITGGNLILNSTSNTNFDISAGSHDRINVSGNTDFNGGVLNINPIGSPSISPGTFVPLLQSGMTNLPAVNGDPYLRVKQVNSTQYNAIDMSGAVLSTINLPSASFVPTAETIGSDVVLGIEGINGIKLTTKANKNNSTPNDAFSVLTTATTGSGVPITLGVAAAALGYDHFNYMQFATRDTEISACITSGAGCTGLETITGSLPAIPYVDAPYGGWAYQGASPGHPVRDFWPFYYDEYFKNINSPPPSPLDPGYLDYYTTGATLKTLGTLGVSPDAAYGFVFSDQPTLSTGNTVSFRTALVGIQGTGCNTLGPSTDCKFQIIPGTTYRWSQTNGVVGFSGPFENAIIGPGVSQSVLDDFVSLTPAELSNSLISVSDFLSDIGLTPSDLAAMGGSIADFSASVEAAIPEPPAIAILIASLMLMLTCMRLKADSLGVRM